MDSFFDAIRGSASSWHESKLFIEHLIAICHDTLHLAAGVAIWLFLAMILRRSIADWLPLLGTAAIAAINEAVDLWVELWPSLGTQLGEGARDLLATIAIPTLLYLAANVAPSILANDQRDRSAKKASASSRRGRRASR